MITEKDKIEQFKRDLRSYNYYLGMIEECNIQLTAIAVRLQGVSSPSIKDVVLENAGNPYSDNRIGLMIEEGKIIDERNKWLSEVKRIDDLLNKLSSGERNVLNEVYVKRKKMESVAERKYISERKLRYDITEIIKKMLDNNQ